MDANVFSAPSSRAHWKSRKWSKRHPGEKSQMPRARGEVVMSESANGAGGLTRRELLRAGALSAAGLAAAGAVVHARGESVAEAPNHTNEAHKHGANGVEGTLRPGGFDPSAFLTA